MGTKIRDLPDTATSVNDNDFLVIASSDNKTKKISGANFKNSISVGTLPVDMSDPSNNHQTTYSGPLGGYGRSAGAFGRNDDHVTAELLVRWAPNQMSGASGRNSSAGAAFFIRFTNHSREVPGAPGTLYQVEKAL